jgi:hypothetical protein
MDVAKIDAPTFLAGFEIAAAGKGGHRPFERGGEAPAIATGWASPGRRHKKPAGYPPTETGVIRHTHYVNSVLDQLRGHDLCHCDDWSLIPVKANAPSPEGDEAEAVYCFAPMHRNDAMCQSRHPDSCSAASFDHLVGADE